MLGWFICNLPSHSFTNKKCQKCQPLFYQAMVIPIYEPRLFVPDLVLQLWRKIATRLKSRMENWSSRLQLSPHSHMLHTLPQPKHSQVCNWMYSSCTPANLSNHFPEIIMRLEFISNSPPNNPEYKLFALQARLGRFVQIWVTTFQRLSWG